MSGDDRIANQLAAPGYHIETSGKLVLESRRKWRGAEKRSRRWGCSRADLCPACRATAGDPVLLATEIGIFRSFGASHGANPNDNAGVYGSTRARNSENPARPYIWRLIILRRLI